MNVKREDQFPWPLTIEFFERAYEPLDWKYQVYVKSRKEFKHFKRYALIYGLEFNRCKFKLSFIKNDDDKENELYYILKLLGVKTEKNIHDTTEVHEKQNITFDLGKNTNNFVDLDGFRRRICGYGLHIKERYGCSNIDWFRQTYPEDKWINFVSASMKIAKNQVKEKMKASSNLKQAAASIEQTLNAEVAQAKFFGVDAGEIEQKKQVYETVLEALRTTRVADYMNTLVNKVIQTCAGLEPGDFEQVFVEIRKEIKRQGKNLTLLIEDVTAFTGVNVALLNVLTTEHTGMYESQELCRISSIVGTTEKYFNVNFMDNHKDRVTQFFVIPNDVFGEDQNSLYEFVGRYLNAMSLRGDILDDWVKNGASMKEYPIHKGEEKSLWDTVEIAKGKELSLFPFTKKAITNLYMCILQPDYRTPRYLLRDVIERAMRNYLFKKESFPEFAIERINDIPFESLYVSTYIHQQVEESQADRVERFIRVWGNASDLEYEESGIKYLGGMPIGFFDDLGIPTFTGRKGDKPVKASVDPVKQLSDGSDITQPPEPIGPKVDPAMADFLLGQRTLQIWIDGGELNVGATTKDVVNITKARDEINKRFLISAINWQIEGVSLDNLNRVKATKDFIGFERQKRAAKNALTILPADRETQGVLEAFLAYVTLGNGSWNFDDSAMMVYRVQNWVEKWKKTIIQTVNVFDNQSVDYQDCAIATEMIREIMQGVFTGTKVEGIPITNLMAKNLKKAVQNSHCTEWNSLVSMLLNNDEKVKDVITQYYNIIQGNLKSSQVFIRATEFNSDVRKVQKAKLLIPDEQILLNDPIPQRREIREIYEKIYTRIPKVAEAEKEKANRLLEQIGMYLDYEDIDDEDIEDLIDKIKDFYATASNSLVNIHGNIQVLDGIKKDAKTISVAFGEVEKGIASTDDIDTLLMFSKDPLTKLERVLSILQTVQKDIEYVARDVEKRRGNILVDNGGDLSTRYVELRNKIELDSKTIMDWKVM